MRKIIATALALVSVLALAAPAMAKDTVVPGHQRYDRDNNDYPDAGKYVNGH